MTEAQKAYRNFMLRSLESYGYDVARTIGWCQNHFDRLNNYQRKLVNSLTPREKNAVLNELTLMYM